MIYFLGQGLPVNFQLSIFYYNIVAREADYPLDVFLLWVARVMKYHNIPAAEIANPIGKFINNDKFSAVEGRLHTEPIYTNAC